MSKIILSVVLGLIALNLLIEDYGDVQASDLDSAMIKAYSTNPSLLAERAGLGADGERQRST